MAKKKAKGKTSSSLSSISISSILVGIIIAFLILVGIAVKQSLSKTSDGYIGSVPSSDETTGPTPTYVPNTGY